MVHYFVTLELCTELRGIRDGASLDNAHLIVCPFVVC